MEPISLGVTALIIAAAHTLKSGTVKNVVDDAKKTIKEIFGENKDKDKKS